MTDRPQKEKNLVELRPGELSALISTGEPITGTLGSNVIDLNQCGPKALQKLAELRGITVEGADA